MIIPSLLFPSLLYCRLGLLSLLTAAFSVCFLIDTGLAQGSFPQGSPPPFLRWENDWDAATARAVRENRHIFIHFCLPNQQMETEVFVQPNIAFSLQTNFVMLKINAPEHPALTQRFSVTAAPTDIILKPTGQLIHRRVGEITAERFADYLAFLQKMIQAENPVAVPFTPAPFPAAESVSAPPAAGPQGIMPPRENVPVPDVIRDPFGGQQTPAAFHAPQHYVPNSSKIPAEEPAPAVARSTQTAVATSDEPASAKMMVEVPLALEGFCPVTLCMEERWASGNPAYCTMYQGHIFRFSSLEALTIFAQDPANYIPVAMGEDVVLMADRNKRVEGNRKFGAWFQGRIFLFSSQESLDAFENRPEFYREIALKYETARKEQRVPVIY